MIPDTLQELVYRGLYLLMMWLSICSNHSSKDWGSLALEIGISLIKCSWNEDDLVILFNASVVCWWNCWVPCVSYACLWNNSTMDWLLDWSGKRFGLGTAGLHKHVEMGVFHRVFVIDACHYLIAVAYYNLLLAGKMSNLLHRMNLMPNCF